MPDISPYRRLTSMQECATLGSMKVAEVNVNKRFTIMVNDREHKDFKIACVEDDKEMAEVLRGFMRDYVKAQQKAAKKK